MVISDQELEADGDYLLIPSRSLTEVKLRYFKRMKKDKEDEDKSVEEQKTQAEIRDKKKVFEKLRGEFSIKAGHFKNICPQLSQ